jgi:hypothetical protein
MVHAQQRLQLTNTSSNFVHMPSFRMQGVCVAHCIAGDAGAAAVGLAIPPALMLYVCVRTQVYAARIASLETQVLLDKKSHCCNTTNTALGSMSKLLLLRAGVCVAHCVAGDAGAAVVGQFTSEIPVVCLCACPGVCVAHCEPGDAGAADKKPPSCNTTTRHWDPCVCGCFCVQVYASRIASLETQVLLDKKPPARLTKELHLLCNDLKGERPSSSSSTSTYSSDSSGTCSATTSRVSDTAAPAAAAAAAADIVHQHEQQQTNWTTLQGPQG